MTRSSDILDGLADVLDRQLQVNASVRDALEEQVRSSRALSDASAELIEDVLALQEQLADLGRRVAGLERRHETAGEDADLMTRATTRRMIEEAGYSTRIGDAPTRMRLTDRMTAVLPVAVESADGLTTIPAHAIVTLTLRDDTAVGVHWGAVQVTASFNEVCGAELVAERSPGLIA